MDKEKLVELAKKLFQGARWISLEDAQGTDEINLLHKKVINWLSKKIEKEATPPGFFDYNKGHLAFIRLKGIPLRECDSYEKAFREAFDAALEAMMDHQEKKT